MDEEDGQKDGRVGASSPTRPPHFARQQHGHPTSAPVASCNRRYGIQHLPEYGILRQSKLAVLL